MIKIGINGFGRIGRCVLRAISETNNNIAVKAINAGFGSLETNYHLLKYDSTHGSSQKFTLLPPNEIEYNQQAIKMLFEPNPQNINWEDLDVDIVLECTGIFTSNKLASAHLASGAKKVIISAPSEDPDITIIMGVNENKLSPVDKIISAGSCTTNCLAPLAGILNREIGIKKGFMTTVHAYTNDQVALDSLHKDKRRARSCTQSMIPTSTGAAKALNKVIPDLAGKIDGIAVRVPTNNVSFLDFTFTTDKSTTPHEINNIIKKAATNSGIISYCNEELVSIDFNHHPASCIFDSSQTKVVDDDFCRVAAWYDNEWGFSNRMIDIVNLIGKKL